MNLWTGQNAVAEKHSEPIELDLSGMKIFDNSFEIWSNNWNQTETESNKASYVACVTCNIYIE